MLIWDRGAPLLTSVQKRNENTHKVVVRPIGDFGGENTTTWKRKTVRDRDFEFAKTKG